VCAGGSSEGSTTLGQGTKLGPPLCYTLVNLGLTRVNPPSFVSVYVQYIVRKLNCSLLCSLPPAEDQVGIARVCCSCTECVVGIYSGEPLPSFVVSVYVQYSEKVEMLIGMLTPTG